MYIIFQSMNSNETLNRKAAEIVNK